MIKEAKANKTLLVNGPASVHLLSGEAEILGASLSVGEPIIVRDGKRTPFYVKKDASFNVMPDNENMVEEVEGDTVPASWHKIAEENLSREKPVVVMIMGEADSGKTSLCTFLANRALREKWTVAVIDADLGQSDLGPPTTVGLAYINKPVRDMFYVKANRIYFVGSTSPGGLEECVVQCILEFRNRAFREKKELLVINTDGWVEGEEAVRYKAMLTEAISPNTVVAIKQGEELEPILQSLNEKQISTVETSSAIIKRDREKRKALRELGYKKYLKNAKVESFPLGWVKIEGIHSSSSLFLTNGRIRRIEEVLGIHPVFCEETVEAIWVVLKRSQTLDFESMRRAEEVFKKKVKVNWKGDEKGLIVGLHDEESRFLGLGVICDIDYRRKVLKVSTPVSQKTSIIRVGHVRLDDKCREVGTASLWN
jgi:polynucleotide 5'-hydroxyl-kinase GRC3/NOL9